MIIYSQCRRVGRGLSLAVICSLLHLLGGCAGSQQQRLGKTYLAAGDYDRAVTAAREALAQDPQNPEYLDLLSDAQTAAADFYFQRAETLMAEHRPGQALVELNQTLEHMPAHPGANTLRVKAEKAILTCKQLSEKSREAIGREDWEQAVAAAQEAVGIDVDDSIARGLLEHSRLALVSRHLARAQMELDAGNAQACLDACATARKWDASNPYLLQMERKANEAMGGDVTGRTEVVASPAPVQAQGVAMVQPGDVQVKAPAATELAAPKSQAQEVAETVANPQAGNVGKSQVDNVAKPQAGEHVAKSPAGEQVASPQADADSPADAPVAAQGSSDRRLIEVRPAAGETARTAQAPSPRSAPGKSGPLITAERDRATGAEPDQPTGAEPNRGELPGATFWVSTRRPSERARVSAERPVSAVASRPAGMPAGGTQAMDGRITDSPRSYSSPRPRGNAPAASAVPALSRSSAAGADAQPRHLFRGAVSRGDRRFKKQVSVVDGISVKLKDTDEDPLDADFEIVSAKLRSEPKDVEVGGKVNLRGASGRTYTMTVIWIDHDQDTVHFSIDRVD